MIPGETIRIRLVLICLPLLVLANLTYLAHNVFGWIVTLTFFLFVPGYLLLRSVSNPVNFGIARISLSIGLSAALITICGLLLNSLHFIGFAKPLQTLYIFAALDFMVIILLLLNRFSSIEVRVGIPHFKLEERIFIILFALLPLFSVFGAIRLNNGATNVLTMIMIILIGTLYIALMIRPRMPKIYPYAIFMTALAILFSISLRGWTITGHDIHHEYTVFNAVMKLGYWSPHYGNGDPYNACLSITILPTILAKITDITPIYIYKIVYQVMLAFIVPAIYIFARKFATAKQGLLGAFAFITFPTFINDLPFLNRQEIAFSYFILILLVNFTKISHRAKSALTVFLLLAIILSHYSSSYVTISVLLLTLVIYRLLSWIQKTQTRLHIPLLSLPIIIMAFLATFVWNMQITASSSNLTGTLTSAINGIIGRDEAKVSTYSLVPNAKKTSPAVQLADAATRKRVVATYVPATTVPLTALGYKLNKVANVTSLNTQLHGLIARLLQVFVVLGAALAVIHFYRHPASPKQRYLLAAIMSFVFALMLFTFVPQLSIGYDVTRLFQQSLTVLWLPIIFFCETLFAWLGKRRLIASTLLLVLIYLNLSGFTSQLTGGYLPTLALNNAGLYYDFFYTHRSDIVGSTWLADKRLGYMTVFQDINSASPPIKYSVALGLPDGRSQGYYYTDYSNNETGHYRTIFTSGFAEYKSPVFTKNKSLIYSNGPTKIYFTWPNPSAH